MASARATNNGLRTRCTRRTAPAGRSALQARGAARPPDVDFALLPPTSDRTSAPLDPSTADGLAHAERGDWHAAATAFDAALARVDVARDADDARLAAALTNLGQARAYLGALDDASALLERSVAVRERLVAAGSADGAVVARGLVDLAAVHAAAGRRDDAVAALQRAHGSLGTPVGGLAEAVAGGLALLGADAPRFMDTGREPEPPHIVDTPVAAPDEATVFDFEPAGGDFETLDAFEPTAIEEDDDPRPAAGALPWIELD